LRPSCWRRRAKFAGSTAASGEMSAFIGSIGESLDAKKISALIAKAIGIKIAIRLIKNETN
jgi:hypothetical protein